MVRLPTLAQVIALGLIVFALTPAWAAQQLITGTASSRERIAVPPGAVFEAILEEVGPADAPAVEIARTRIESPGQPPIAFSIAYDPAAIDERLTYAVRTRVLVGERLMFASDTVHRVLTRGAPREIAVLMRMVGKRNEAPGETQGAAGAHGLRLPATFKGDLPCADCEGIRHHLNLWPDQAFSLRRVWLGTDASRDDLGRWSVDSGGRALILWDVGETPLRYEILNNQRLRQLDTQGKPIVSDLPYELASQGALEPLDVHLFIGGMFVYMADAARLTECRTGRSFPVAMEGDYRRLEKAYLEARQSLGESLMVTFDGSIEERPRAEGGGTEATAVVRRFVDVWPGETCERRRADVSLTNTYWRIVKLGDADIHTEDGHREPHLLLRANEARFSATVGCNQLIGGYEAAGETLSFRQVASTMMACPPPLDRLERRLAEALANARTWRITGQVLELRNDQGRPVALFQAVYLR
jgi:uncharacterized lipoprotein YbaY/heat shock protein HslJ/uncharacterized lipoprotein NlpE involved in copper resistance